MPAWGQAGKSAEVMVCSTAKPAQHPTHSATVNCNSAAKSAPLTSATPMKEQLLVVFWVGFQGGFFNPS